jgi:hypothetical protein
MNGDKVLTVLKEIRDEAKQTNTRLESLEGRVDFLERRMSKGLADLAAKQAEVEIRVATEVVSLAGVTREVRDLLERKLDDHEMVIGHEHRIKALEQSSPR